MARRIPLKTLAQLCRRVGTSLNAGVDARKTWGREVERAQGTNKRGLNAIYTAVAAGQSTADGIRAAGEFLPPLVHDLVKMGEQTGHVDQVFLELADHYENLVSLRRTYLNGITWPAMQLSMALAVVGFLIWITGSLQGIDGQPIDLLGFGLVGTSGLIIYLTLLGCAVCGVGFLIEGWRQGKLGVQQLMKWLIRVPILGDCVRTDALARMAWSLGLAVDTGMGARQCMQTALESTSNAYFTELKSVVDPELAKGVPFNEALRKTGAFPLEFLDTLEVGEQSGRITESLARLSSQYHERAKAQSEIMTKVATFLTWGTMGLIMIMIIFRLALFYVGTINSLL